VQVCANFTQEEELSNKTRYAAALPLAAILQPNVTSSVYRPTSGYNVVMVTVNMTACPYMEIQVIVEALTQRSGEVIDNDVHCHILYD